MSDHRVARGTLTRAESEAVERVLDALASTGHPVLDVLLVSGEHSAAGPYARAEFLYDADVVGVVRARLGRSDASYTVRGGSRTRGPANGRRWLERLGAGIAGPVVPRRLHASNEDLRALTETPEGSRLGARELVRRLGRDEVRLTGRVDSDLGSLVALLALDEGHDGDVATHRDAARGLRLVEDLTVGAPVEWALRRFTAGSE